MKDIFSAKIVHKILCECCRKYELPEILSSECYCRKDVQLIQYVVNPYQWELEFWQQNGYQDLLGQYSRHINTLFAEFCVPRLEKAFAAAVRDIYFTDRQIAGSSKYGYIFVQYCSNLSSKAAPAEAKRENGLAHLLARAMRKFNGRGPDNIRAILLADQVTVYLVARFMSEIEQRYAAASSSNAQTIADFYCHVLRQAVFDVHAADFTAKPQVFVWVNPYNNQGVAIIC